MLNQDDGCGVETTSSGVNLIVIRPLKRICSVVSLYGEPKICSILHALAHGPRASVANGQFPVPLKEGRSHDSIRAYTLVFLGYTRRKNVASPGQAVVRRNETGPSSPSAYERCEPNNVVYS